MRLEKKIGSDVSIGIEYLYTGYDEAGTLIRVGHNTALSARPLVLAGGVDFSRANDDFNLQTVKAVIAYRY